MHYFSFNVADYTLSTAHLTPLEDLTYRRLLDFYYSTEKPIPLETQWVAKRIRCEEEHVVYILKEYFSLCDDGYRNERADKEIAKYNAICNRNKVNGKAGGRPNKTQSVISGLPEESKENPSGSQTNNQEPLTNTKPKTNVRTPSAPCRFEEFWNAWPKTPRKVAKAACLKKWKLKGLDAIADSVIQHVNAMKLTKPWLDGYEPAPMTYLNQGRWGDEVVNGSEAVNGKPWILVASKIEKKGEEAGIAIDPNAPWTEFRTKVFQHYGVTPDEFRKAKIDYPN
jgi:uncharacterized protein YdaU (DUF1376 family)